MYNLNRLPLVAKGLDIFYKDCAITVALKIADDSCKMDDYEKSIFMALYDAITDKSTELFDEGVFEVITTALHNPSAKIYAEVKKLREFAMQSITQPKMKAFKAEIRRQLLE